MLSETLRHRIPRIESIASRMDQVVAKILEAADARQWDEVKLLLHPYLHWSDREGLNLRGRTNVLRWLAEREAPLTPPARIELRDGQIYRWTS